MQLIERTGLQAFEISSMLKVSALALLITTVSGQQSAWGQCKRACVLSYNTN